MPDFHKPFIYRLSKQPDRRQFEKLLDSHSNLKINDHFTGHLDELFKIEFPYILPGTPEYKNTYRAYLSRYYPSKDLSLYGVWVHYPWQATVVHLPDELDFTRLRSARNRELITPEEQERFYDSRICIAGLSVGLSIINNVVLCGGSRSITLADPDVLSLTNMNRLSASVSDIGEKKVRIAARRVYEQNPFSKLTIFEKGVSESNIDTFLGGDKPVDLFIEEMDNIKLKVVSRIQARKRKIPVVMATDNGDNAIVDVERFDLEPNRLLFHGLVDESELVNISDHPTLSERVRLASIIVGHDITTRTKTSLQMVGSKIPSWPQLGTAATLSGVVVSFVARRILSSQSMPSGRYYINIDQVLDASYTSKASKNERISVEQQYAQGLELLFGVK